MKIPNYTLGLVTGFCFAVLYFMVPTIIDGFRKPSSIQATQSNFKVVDTYRGKCDVVRWEQSNIAEYKYFMRCDK